MSSDFLDRINNLSAKRLALLALELHEQVEAANESARAPIAVIGIGCRFPGGVDDPQAYWDLLRAGRDAIREVPGDRWDIDAWFDPDPDAPARMSVRNGGFLDRIDGFDNAFFGISPREALTMDPQQRLLLEVSWEALEHAGLAPEGLVGSATGVFVGICNSDHFSRVMQRGAAQIDSYLASGNAHSVAAGRISYSLGLQGPAISVDTACSSSLLALHLACQSLRRGESDMALSGGVNVMCAPETTIALTKGHMLAPDGRCKTFDARADGFARGEGCGVIVLKRLNDAIDFGDRVLAVIRGTAANQDGRSGGLTVPNGPAQEAVIRAALADAGVAPADIDYVEAHGTGTTLGDPIEVRALAGALGPGRDPDRPLIVGSVKTNIGHLESAAGIAGVIKVILSLQQEAIPRHLHFHEPSPHIAWDQYPVTVAANGRPWQRGERRRLAGVSSFGFSGTNAHVIIEEAPLVPSRTADLSRPLHCLALSARSDAALRVLAQQYADVLSTGAGQSLLDVAHTAGFGRSHFGERVAVVADSSSAARIALLEFAAGRAHQGVHRASAPGGQVPDVVFMFTGQGSQYPGMARRLYDSAPVFRDVIDQCDALLGPDAAGQTLKSVMWTGEGDTAPVHDTAWTQPSLFAVEYGLTQLWRSWGIEPAAVIGHSVGEYVAACVAGVFSLEDGLKLIAERGRLMRDLPPGGTMAALFAPVAEVMAAVAPWADRVAIAAVNAADSVVISGEAATIEALLEDFARRNVRGHRLFVSLAAHSPLVAPALDAMEACAARVAMHAPQVPVAWNVTGGAALPSGDVPNARYWRRHLREPVRFADGLAKLHADGYRTFLEVGPHPTLIALAQRSLSDQGNLFLTSLRRGQDDWSEILNSLAQLYTRGARVDWAAVDQPYGSRRIELPRYPFEHKSFWIPTSALEGNMHAPSAHHGVDRLVGKRVPTAVPVYETVLEPGAPAYLAQHRVLDAVLVAGPVFLELAQACALDVYGPAPRAVEHFTIHEPLVLREGGRAVQVNFVPTRGAPNGHEVAFSIHSNDVDRQGEWHLHVTGQLVAVNSRVRPALDVPALASVLGPVQDCAGHYARLRELGIDLGPAFQSLQRAHRHAGQALAWIELQTVAGDPKAGWAHPALLDGAMQAVGLAVPECADQDEVYLLTAIDRIEIDSGLPCGLWCHVKLAHSDQIRPTEWRADVDLYAIDGRSIGALRGVSLRRATRAVLQNAVGGAHSAQDANLYYRVEWAPTPVAAGAAPSLHSPDQFVPAIRQRFDILAEQNGAAVYDQLLPELDRLSAEHIAVALRRLGFDATAGRRFDAGSEALKLGIAARHARLFARCLAILAEDGVLAPVDGGYEVLRDLPSADPAQRYDALLARFGAVDGELRTLRRCAGELARVLTGEQDPLHLLFPAGSLAEARQLYVESPYARTYNAALAESLRAAIAGMPAGVRLRVLEVGAGTGGTTSYVLPALQASGIDSARLEYTFTDLSPLFLERAAQQFAQYPFVRYALLDIERDPVAQGFGAGQYDVVIAANVLHATADLRKAVEHVRDLLAPGGMVYLLEGVAPERWVDLTFGMTEGWWRFSDTSLRADYPLIERAAWLDLLAALGYTDASAIPSGSSLSRGLAQQALVIARTAVVARTWTLVGSVDEFAPQLAEVLRARGDIVAIRDVDDDAAPILGDLVYLGALELAPQGYDAAAGIEASERLAGAKALTWLAKLARQPAAGRAWLVTHGALRVDRQALPGGRWQSPVWGLGRVFALEHPALWGGLVDLAPDAAVADRVDQMVRSLDADDGEDQTAWRGGARLAARLMRCDPVANTPIALRPDATYLVTGGFGGLGLLIGRWLAQNGARHVALLGRNPDPQSDGVRAIETLGANVICLAGDVADAQRMKVVLEQLARTAPPVRGVLHAAADLGVAPMADLGTSQLQAMLRPKLRGTVVLETLLRTADLDFMVLFSSTTALLGASGFAHYAAANVFLDETAQAASARGARVFSVNWGTWEAMRLASALSQQSFREGGLQPMPAALAFHALAKVMAGTNAQTAVALIDWSILKPLHEVRRRRPLLSGMDESNAKAAIVAGSASAADTAHALKARLAQAAPEGRIDVLVDFVQGEVASVLSLDRDEPISPEVGLFEMGMDSLMSVELKRRLERGAGRSLPSTLTFNYPNIGALAKFLEQELVDALADLAPQGAASAAAVAVAGAASCETMGDDLHALSDDELEARLLARLKQTQ